MDPPPATSPVSPTVEPSHADRPVRRPLSWWVKRLLSAAVMIAAGLLVIAAVGVAQRAGWIRTGGTTSTTASAPADGTVYTCPMHPQIRQPMASRCPICGMELVPATAAGADLDEFSVMIEPAQRRLAQIETESVRREPVTARLQSIGAIAIDESRMATISSYITGRVERLFADYTGVDVAQGDHLAVIYSPQLYSAQVEYLESRSSLNSNSAALDIVRQTQQKLVESARHRLVELGMTSEQMATLERSNEAESRLTIYAPMGGTVTEKLLVEGDYVEAGQAIYRIANLSTVWLILELFPDDASRIRFGQLVEAEIQSLPGETFQGRVAFIDPTVDPKKRTVGVRVEFLNEDRRLRPGDYASATVSLPIGPMGEVYDEGLAGKWISPMHPQIIRDVPGQCPICGMDLIPTTRFGYAEVPVRQPTSLVIPRSALLLAGSNSVVYVEVEPGRFEIRPVTIGPILADRVIILDGLQEDDLVATAGNFLIDSQMQLAGKPSLIDPARAVAALKDRDKPLKLTDRHAQSLTGETGRDVENLFATYFRIQESLAGDAAPAEADAAELRQLATSLLASEELRDKPQQLLKSITAASEHLAHLPIEQARLDAFRPISHAVVELAALMRGENGDQPFYHMYCPMVKGGDWLQDRQKRLNPYMGKRMLDCGDTVRVFSVPDSAGPSPREPAKKNQDVSTQNELAAPKATTSPNNSSTLKAN